MASLPSLRLECEPLGFALYLLRFDPCWSGTGRWNKEALSLAESPEVRRTFFRGELMLFVVTLSRAPGADLGEISEKLLAPPGHDWEEYIWLTIYKLEEKGEIPVVGPVRAKEIINYPLPRHMWEMMEKERRKTLWKVSAAIGSGPVVEFSPEISKKLSPGAYKIEATLDTLSLPRSPQYLRILLKTHAYFTVLKPSTPKEKVGFIMSGLFTSPPRESCLKRSERP